MKKVQRMLNFHTYKRLFCANFYVIAKIYFSSYNYLLFSTTKLLILSKIKK